MPSPPDVARTLNPPPEGCPGIRRRTAVVMVLPLLAAMLARPGYAAPWDEFQLIMWQDQTPVRLAGLLRLGFTAAKLNGNNGIDPAALAMRHAAGMPYYVENIATDFYAPYHRFRANAPVTMLFDQAKARLRADPANTEVFQRTPSLSDRAWRHTVAARLSSVVAAQRGDYPLFYTLGDETGIGDLAAAWDADVSPPALEAFRAWLRTVYADLPALNRQWSTAYDGWDAVIPELTDAALRRTDGDFSAWEDFKAWMDVAFADAVRMGTDAVHNADPDARAALEGGQVPGWGGYDYSLLAPAVDVMEIYDEGNAAELAQAFNPALIQLRTSFGTGPREEHAGWRSLLQGGRGMVVWDEAGDVVHDDGTPGPRGTEIAELVARLRPVATRLWTMQPSPDAVAILISQSSFRLRWLLDRQAEPGQWWERDAEREYDDNAWRAARRQVTARLTALGIAPRWLARAGLEQGVPDGIRVLLLPHAIGLSDREVVAIQAFAARGGTVLADTEPGAFDGHGRRRLGPPLTGVARLSPGMRSDDELDVLAEALRQGGVLPAVEVTTSDGRRAQGVEVRLFQRGVDRLIALQVAQPFLDPGPLTLRWRGPALATELTTGAGLGRLEQVTLTLDPVRPAVVLLEP